MNSSEMSAQVVQQAPARPAFNWIEWLAVPVATTLMETQPILLLLLFVHPALALETGLAPLDELSISLFLLAMLWWGLVARTLAERGMSSRRVNGIHSAGLVVALAAMVLTHLVMLNDLLLLVVSCGLIVWFWKQGLDLANPERGEERLTSLFRTGFFVLIIVLVLTMFFQNPTTATVAAALPAALPLFFLSGLLALSFSRLTNIAREQASQGSLQSGATRTWALGLTIAWIIIVAISLALELYSFQAVQSLLIPVWAFLGTILTWILYGIFQVISFIFTGVGSVITFLLHLLGIGNGQPPKLSLPNIGSHPPAAIGQKGPQAAQSDTLLIIGRITLIVVAIALTLIVMRLVQRRWSRTTPDDSEEEMRESLSLRDIRNERRLERQQQNLKLAEPALETLEPASARASYRDLLQTMALEGGDRGRRPGETPTEYQQRLLLLNRYPPLSEPGAPADPAILDELTRAYQRERYGARPTNQQERTFLQQWVPYLTRRLKRNPTGPGTR